MVKPRPLPKVARTHAAARGDARARVLRVALEHFASKGFEGSGLREIAASAGVTHPLILYHFGSMDGLWRAVVGGLFIEYRSRVQGRLGGLRALDPKTFLKVAIEDFIRFSMERPELHRILTMEGRRLTPRLKWLIQTYLKPTFEQTSAVIARGQREGSIRPFDPALLYYAVIGLCAAPFAQAPEIEAVTGRRVRAEETVVELARMVATLIFEPGNEVPRAKRRKGKGAR